MGFAQRIEASQDAPYTGDVVVLIDESAISQAEHTCLMFEGATQGRLRFVGTPTNGANGDVTSVSVPGGITMMFSGHDVRHADGRQLQRVGIQPDLMVAPTVAGIAAGRDEILEAALELLTADSG